MEYYVAWRLVCASRVRSTTTGETSDSKKIRRNPEKKREWSGAKLFTGTNLTERRGGGSRPHALTTRRGRTRSNWTSPAPVRVFGLHHHHPRSPPTPSAAGLCGSDCAGRARGWLLNGTGDLEPASVYARGADRRLPGSRPAANQPGSRRRCAYMNTGRRDCTAAVDPADGHTLPLQPTSRCPRRDGSSASFRKAGQRDGVTVKPHPPPHPPPHIPPPPHPRTPLGEPARWTAATTILADPRSRHNRSPMSAEPAWRRLRTRTTHGSPLRDSDRGRDSTTCARRDTTYALSGSTWCRSGTVDLIGQWNGQSILEPRQ